MPRLEQKLNLQNEQKNFGKKSSIQYSAPSDYLIVDNRGTSLMKDYYKLIGTRYVFQLE